MSLLKSVRRLFAADEVPADLASAGVTLEHMRELGKRFEEEAAKPPRIAFVGETGVGKTSTINALFNKGLEISHSKACTKEETEVVGSRGGPIVIVDLPGVGEDLEADEAHFTTYARVLPTVDLVLWILKADNRAMTNVQRALQRLVADGALDPHRLVLALNQIDQVQPGAWNAEFNIPSVEQEATIEERRKDALTKVGKVVKIGDDQVIAYSAKTYYNLDDLVVAMLGACDERRKWLLYERADCADFASLATIDMDREMTP